MARPRTRPDVRPVGREGGGAGPAAAALLTLLAGVWLVMSPFVLPYPSTGDGADARWREITVGLVTALFGVVRLRRPATAWASCLACLVVGAVLVTAPKLFGYARGDVTEGVWWNEVVTGGFITVLALLGLTGRRRRPRPPAAGP